MEIELSKKQGKAVLDAIVYRIDGLIIGGEVSKSFSKNSNYSDEDLLNKVIYKLARAGFSKVEFVSNIEDANCIVQIFKEECCESDNSLFDICGAITFVKIDEQWVNYLGRKWDFDRVLFEIEISYPEFEMGEDFAKYFNAKNVFLSLS